VDALPGPNRATSATDALAVANDLLASRYVPQGYFVPGWNVLGSGNFEAVHTDGAASRDGDPGNGYVVAWVKPNDDIFRTWRDPDADEITHWRLRTGQLCGRCCQIQFFGGYLRSIVSKYKISRLK
jgi:hypothetical protein